MVDSDILQARLQAVDSADSAQSMIDAVEALAALQSESAIDMLIRVLGYNNPGAAVAAVDGLIGIGTPAASAVLSQIDGYNYGARAWALRVLSGIGDPRGLDLILETASEDFSLSVRRAAARGLGAIQWEKLEQAERRLSQIKVRDTLLRIVEGDPEWVVRYAATVGLQGLAMAMLSEEFTDVAEIAKPIAIGLLERAEKDDTLAVRVRAGWAVRQLPEILTESI